MNKFFNYVKKVFMLPVTKLAEQRHLKAIHYGIVSAMPLIIVGSFFLIIAFPPIPSLARKMSSEIVYKILIPFRLTLGLISLYVSYGTGYSLAKSYKIDGVYGGILAMTAFILTSIPLTMDKVGFVLPMINLGGNGIFIAIFMSIFSVEIMRLLETKDITIKVPEGVPDAVISSLGSLIPYVVIIILIWFIRVIVGFNIQEFIINLFKPLLGVGNTLIGILIPILLITLLWSTGIHGVSVVGFIARPIWIVLIYENMVALAEGSKVLPNIVSEPFFQWFVWIGGSGATLGLVFLFINSKSKHLKQLGKVSLLSSICNINESVIFGAPIILNSILAIPFIVGPIVIGIITYFAMYFNLVNRPFVLVPWALPAPIGAYLSTGGDWRAIVLVIINIIVMTLIYYPFFKVYERKLLKSEQRS